MSNTLTSNAPRLNVLQIAASPNATWDIAERMSNCQRPPAQ